MTEIQKIEKIGLKDDKGKLRYDLIPVEVLTALAKVLTYGAQKYKPNSWQNVEDGTNKHYAALFRHLISWRSGEKLDSESGLNHIDHALANMAFLVYHESKNG